MSNFPDNLLYTKDHEWCRIEGDVATVGITWHAQSSLGDVVFCELPKVGDSFEQSAPFGSVESVKAVSELFIPLSGEVLEVNGSLESKPELLNTDPYGAGWLVKIRVANAGQANELLKADAYEAHVKEAE